MGDSGAVEVRVLGPFQVTVGGRPVDVPRGRLRAMLVALALSAGQAVGVDALAERVWGPDLPASTRSAVHNNIRRLRILLGADVIRTNISGYLMDVDPDQVDAHRFLRLLGAAAGARSGEALDRLREALALWRGEPLTGVDSESLRDDHAPALTERYLGAVEQLVDLDLAAGRDGRPVAELRELIARHPLRESLWMRLLTVLHSAGRHAEALEAYEILRQRLADALGADPSPELQRMYRRILSADAEAPATARDGAEAPDGSTAGRDGGRVADLPARLAGPPRQLPPDVASFVGRAEEMAALDGILHEFLDSGADRHVMLVVVHGPGGAGKTALAVRWARRAAAHFPDGQLFLGLRGYGPGEPISVDTALAALLRSLGVPDRAVPVAAEERAALLRTTVTGRRLILLLDNARDADQVRPLLPGANALVLVTSRSQLRGLSVRDGARRLVLREMGECDAVALVSETIGSGRVEREASASTELIQLCGRLPLALRIAAELAVRYPDASLAELVEDLRRQRLEALADPDDPAADPRAVFSWSYRSLGPTDALVFRRLGLHPGREIGLHAAAALVGEPLGVTRRLLDRLVAVHLLEQQLSGRYHLHDLLREYAAEQAGEEDSAEDRGAAVRRVLDWYLQTAEAASQALMPGRQLRTGAVRVAVSPGLAFEDSLAALDWYDTERESLVAAVRRASEIGADDVVWRMADAMSACFLIRPVWDEWESVYATALISAQRLGDPGAQAATLAGLGNLRSFLGANEDAAGYYRWALELFRKAGARAQEATVLSLIASQHEQIGDHDEALRRFQESVAIAREIGDEPREAHALNNLAITYLSLGLRQEALDASRRALRIRRELGDPRGAAHALDNLGDAYVELGEHAKAVEQYREALAIVRILGDRRGEGIYLGNLARAELGDGRPEQAHRTAEQAWAALAGLPDTEAARIRGHLRKSFPGLGH